MENIIAFEPQEAQLKAQLLKLREQVALLDAKEPKNMESEAYELWADEHEELEDAIDELLDQLDALEE